ncbi:MAG: recombination-associated protein RdgC [Gammaproteobacteria bacterium]|jgi:recombination associated protein RdgC
MWFKQIQFFQLSNSIPFNTAALETQLEQFAFAPCSPNSPNTMGWVAPQDEANAPIVYSSNGCMLICLQIEEKILPTSVINQKIKEEASKIEVKRGQKISKKEKQTMKGNIYYSLLPKAFGKITRLYAYIDTKNNWLILNNTSPKKVELFTKFFKKSIQSTNLVSPELKRISKIITGWLQNSNHPKSLTIDDACILQDPKKQGRIIRCQQQDLSAPSIQSLIKDGCEVNQILLTWQDRISFALKNDFTLRSLKYQDSLIEMAKESSAENEQDRFDADFIIMADVINRLMIMLLKLFNKN